MDNSNQRQIASSVVDNRRSYDGECFNYDKSSFSRRSIDWRDSGIVIDEDNHLFHSFENICNLNTQSSLRSETGNEFDARSTDATSGREAQEFVLEQDDDGDTILHLAVVGFSLDRVKDLISLCDLNTINNMMQTPLHVAVLANRPEMVKVLVESGARLDIHDRRGNTPLHLACQKGISDIVNIILSAVSYNSSGDNGLTLKHTLETCNFDGLTCLHLAAINNHKGIIDLLVRKYQARSTIRDSKSGETVLHMAVRQFNVELVEFLLHLVEHSYATDYSGRDPIATIKVLMDSSKTDINERTKGAKIKQLIEMRISECAAKGGCCVSRQCAQIGPSDSADWSSSSSDFSDSDTEMN